MWASFLPAEGFSGPQRAVVELGRAGQPGRVHLCLRRRKLAGRRVVEPERLARSPELQDANALKAGEGLVIERLELGTDRAR